MLQTHRLYLRPVDHLDLDFLTELYGDAQVMSMFAYCVPLPPDSVKSRLNMWIERWEKKELSFFSVVEKLSSNVIGIVGGGVDKNKQCEFAYLFRTEFWGKGYGFEAVKAFVDYARTLQDVKIITATVLPRNQASLRILQKLGMNHTRTTTLYGNERYVFEINK